MYARRLAIGIALVVSGFAAASGENRLPAKEKFHIYLLAGQSNMAGRGKIDPKTNRPHARVLMLNKQNRWVPAKAPLHFDKPRIAGAGIGEAFGRALAEADKTVTIGLVPCAVGGSPLRRWVKTGDLFAAAVKRGNIAMKAGTLQGVLWHQGESDCRDAARAKSYGTRLAGVIGAFRKDLNAPKLPFVVGELGRFLSEKRYPHFKLINRQLNALPQRMPYTACVSSKGLQAKRDGVHFDTRSLHEYGGRYAKAVVGIRRKAAKK